METFKKIALIALALIIAVITLSVAFSVMRYGFSFGVTTNTGSIGPRIISAPILKDEPNQNTGYDFNNQENVPNPYVNPQPNQTACTAEARQCPDGTYTGRSGPQCLFYCPNGVILN